MVSRIEDGGNGSTCCYGSDDNDDNDLQSQNLEIVPELYCLEYQLLIEVQAGQSLCLLN